MAQETKKDDFEDIPDIRDTPWYIKHLEDTKKGSHEFDEPFLIYCFRQSRWNIIKMKLVYESDKYDVNMSHNNSSLIYWACLRNSTDMCKFLMSRGANPNRSNWGDYDRSPMWYAIYNKLKLKLKVES